MAIDKRKELSGDYNFPFLSYYRQPVAKSNQNLMKPEKEGIRVHLPSDDVQVDDGIHIRMLNLDFTYDIHFWDGKRRKRVDDFNFRWCDESPKSTMEITIPWQVPNQQSDFDHTWNNSLLLNDLIDNSDLARANPETGVQIQYTGEINVQGLGFITEGDAKLIKKIELNFWHGTQNDRYLLRQVIET